MTGKQALRALIEAVEAGERAFLIDFFTPLNLDDKPEDLGLIARNAYNGSLDAAKALHEAMLPGWPKNLNFTEHASEYYCCIFGPLPDDAGKWDFAPKSEARAKTTARAWLIAILKAYEAQQ